MAADDAASGRTLALRIVAGERGAIEECYAQYNGRLRRYLNTLVGPNDAEDVLQEVFTDLWKGRTRLDPDRPLEAWLVTVSRRRAIDQLRRRRPGEIEQGAAAPEKSRDVFDRYGRSEQVRQALASLSPEQRRVLELGYFHDLPQREIAEYLGVPLGTVKARMFRGLRQLGIRLRQEGWP